MNIINGPTGPYENAECTRVAQLCSTQAVNWPVWRMMNRAGVRIVFPGVPPRTRLETRGGMKQLQYSIRDRLLGYIRNIVNNMGL